MKPINSLLIIALLVIGQKVFAQPGERVQQLKIAFLTEELDLSVTEAQQFWPVYNQHESERDKLEARKREGVRLLKDKGDKPSEQDVRKSADLVTEAKIAMAELDRKFIEDCLPILGAEKTARLIRAEEEFKRRIMERLKEERGGNRPPRKP